MASHTVIISLAVVVHDVPEHATKFTGSGYAECTCGWKSPHFAHDDDLGDACNKHDETHHPEHTGTVVQEILHQVIRDRTSLDLIQSIVQEARGSLDYEVHLTNTNDISDPPHLPAYESEDGLTLVTLVNNEQEALVAHRYARAARWDSPTHTYITRD